MAVRKTNDDVLARTAAERVLGDALEAEGLIDSAVQEPTEAGVRLLGLIGAAVEFEKGESRDPDRNIVPMRRIVITGPWVVDPDGLRK